MTYDVAIVGGGAIGLCTAYYLQRQGAHVGVFDRSMIGGPASASYGNAGWVVPSHFVPLAAPGVISQGLKWMLDSKSPFYVKPRLDLNLIRWLLQFRRHCTEAHVDQHAPLLLSLGLESRRLYAEMANEPLIEFGYAAEGLLYTARTARGHAENLHEAELAERMGYEVDYLTASEVTDREPALRDDLAGGVYFPLDAHLTPQRFQSEMPALLSERGAALHGSVSVTGFQTAGNRVTGLETSAGPVTATETVLAGGAWSGELLREMDVRLLMEPAKGYSLTTIQPDPPLRTPTLLAEAKVAVTPMLDGQIRYAGTLELAGPSLTINQRRVEAIAEAVPNYFHSIAAEPLAQIEPWAGLRPCTPDGLPYIGRPQGVKGLTVAAGHAMVGMSLAPVTGRLVADAVDGKPAPKAFAVDRFS
ncbi:MAG: FAD-dependent oxidoreductase [Bacteroidota bacterium]